MMNVLADLALEVEAATALAFRLARAFDTDDDASSKLLRRLVTPAAKFWICKRGPTLVGEALEVLGGNGYVEASGMPRLYREAPVYSIWEGSGNVICLDVLRALQRGPTVLAPVAGAVMNWENCGRAAGAGELQSQTPPMASSTSSMTPSRQTSFGASRRPLPRP